LQSGQFDKSVTALEKVFQVGDGISDRHLLLGLAHLGWGNRAAALK